MTTSELAAVLLTVLVVAALAAFGAIGYVAFKNTEKGGAKSFGLLTTRTLRAATVLLVVYATVLLALAEKLTQGAIAILAGIAGYVLGADRGSGWPASSDDGEDAPPGRPDRPSASRTASPPAPDDATLIGG